MKRMLMLGALGLAALAGSVLLLTQSAGAETINSRRAPVDAAVAPLPYGPAVSWTGIYVGTHIGYGAADAALSCCGGTIDGLSATGKLGGVTLGADWQIPNSFLVLGVRGGYRWNDVNFTAFGFKAGLTDGWFADGRVGIAMGTAMPYMVAGLGKTHTTVTGGGSPDLSDWHAGLGVELRMPKSMETGWSLTPTVSFEGLYTDYENKTFGPITMNVSELSYMAHLNLRFK